MIVEINDYATGDQYLTEESSTPTAPDWQLKHRTEFDDVLQREPFISNPTTLGVETLIIILDPFLLRDSDQIQPSSPTAPN